MALHCGILSCTKFMVLNMHYDEWFHVTLMDLSITCIRGNPLIQLYDLSQSI